MLLNKPSIEGFAYIGVGKITEEGEIIYFAKDSTTSKEWTLLRMITSVRFESGDSVIVILHSGITSGPMVRHSLFDHVIFEVITDYNEPSYSSSVFLSEPIPNPATNSVSFSFQLEDEISNGYLVIQNLLGKELFRISIKGNNNLNIDLSSFPPGMYFCRINSNNRYSAIRKLVITK